MEVKLDENKLAKLLDIYKIKISNKEKISNIIELKIIELFENDKIDEKIKDNIYYKYLGLYHQYKTKDYDKMEDAYFILLNKGDTEIMLILGDFYRDTEPDFNEMKRFYLMAAKKGNSQAYMRLSDYFKLKGNILYHKKCLEKALEDSEDDILLKIGYKHQFEDINYDLMKKYYDMSIKKGNSMALNNMGVYYYNILHNYNEAIKYYKMSIDKGCVKAMLNLGLYYEKIKNYEEMEKYYQMGVEKGDSDAMYNLGIFYQNKVNEISLQYFHMAAQKGHKGAIKKIADLNNENII